MKNIRKGLYAGLSAGLILALLYAVDYGPGTNLHTAAKWIALDNKIAGAFIGFVVILVLGAVFGVAFGAFQRDRDSILRRSIISGVFLGVAWLVILVILLGGLVDHISLRPYNMMLFLVTSLLFGLLTGYVYYYGPFSRAE